MSVSITPESSTSGPPEAAPSRPATPAAGEIRRLLAAAISHGVRTPLHSLLGFLELLAVTDLDTDQHRMLDELMSGADSLLTASDRLLLLVSMLAGGEPPRQEADFAPADLVGEVIAELPADGLTSVRIDRSLPARLLGDRSSLRQLLTELVGNALRYGTGPVSIAVDRAGSDRVVADQHVPVRISVADHGPGLTGEQLRRLNAAVPTVPDTSPGLGIFLAQHLAGWLGGQLAATVAPSGGTEVAVRLTLAVPVQPEAELAQPLVALAYGQPDSRPMRVLLVDDNAVNRILTERQIARLGHKLDTLSNGRAATEAALSGKYDLILLDRHLPDRDGLAVARSIRAAEAGRGGQRRVPIVALTADASPGHREQCLAAGMDGFLTKPLDLDGLSATLAEFTPVRPSTGIDALLDPLALDRLTEQLGAPAVVDLVHAYLDELPARRFRLQHALRRYDARRTIAAAESLRAASVTLGAAGVARLAATVGAAAHAGDLKTGRGLLPELLDACAATTQALTDWPPSGH